MSYDFEIKLKDNRNIKYEIKTLKEIKDILLKNQYDIKECKLTKKRSLQAPKKVL